MNFKLEEDGSFELVNTIAENRLDAAFIRTKAYQNPGIRIFDLLEKPMILASPEG